MLLDSDDDDAAVPKHTNVIKKRRDYSLAGFMQIAQRMETQKREEHQQQSARVKNQKTKNKKNDPELEQEQRDAAGMMFSPRMLSHGQAARAVESARTRLGNVTSVKEKAAAETGLKEAQDELRRWVDKKQTGAEEEQEQHEHVPLTETRGYADRIQAILLAEAKDQQFISAESLDYLLRSYLRDRPDIASSSSTVIISPVSVAFYPDAVSFTQLSGAPLNFDAENLPTIIAFVTSSIHWVNIVCRFDNNSDGTRSLVVEIRNSVDSCDETVTVEQYLLRNLRLLQPQLRIRDISIVDVQSQQQLARSNACGLYVVLFGLRAAGFSDQEIGPLTESSRDEFRRRVTNEIEAQGATDENSRRRQRDDSDDSKGNKPRGKIT